MAAAMLLLATTAITFAPHTTKQVEAVIKVNEQAMPGMHFTYSVKAAVKGLQGEDAVMQTALDGTAMVPITNDTENYMEFDVGDAIGYAQHESEVIKVEDLVNPEHARKFKQLSEEQKDAVKGFAEHQHWQKQQEVKMMESMEMGNFPTFVEQHTSSNNIDEDVDPFRGGRARRPKQNAGTQTRKAKREKKQWP